MEAQNPVVIRSRTNRILAVATWVIAVALAAATLVADGRLEWSNLVLAALFALVGWFALWRPAVRVDDGGVELTNVTHTVAIPWDAVIQVDTKFALSIRTPERAYSAWSAPAPGRMSSRGALAARRKDAARANDEMLAPVSLGERTSDLAKTDSGDAAIAVRERWQRMIDSDRITIGAADSTTVSLSIHSVAITLVAVSVIGYIALVAVG